MRLAFYKGPPTGNFCSEAIAAALGISSPDRITPAALYDAFTLPDL